MPLSKLSRSVRGLNVFITGAGSGMGRLATWRLAADGAAVAAVDVDAAGLDGTLEITRRPRRSEER